MRTVIIGGLILAQISTFAMAEPLAVKIGYLGRGETKATISLIDFPPNNDGVAGVRLALDDNNTTGKFLNQHFALEEVRIKEGDDPVESISQLADRGISFFIVDLPAEALLKVADAGRPRGLVFFNVGAIDDRLREEDCRPNVIHTAPTRSMLADGLAQYLVVKRWRRWLLVVGSHDPDKLYADALRRAAARFGAKIVQERVVRGHRRRAAYRQRPRSDPAPDAAVPAGRPGLRRAGCCRRKRGVRILPAVSHA